MSNKSQQQRKLKAVTTDVEAELRQKREQKCASEINVLLEKYRCQFSIVCQVGEAMVPLDQVIKLPVAFNVVSK